MKIKKKSIFLRGAVLGILVLLPIVAWLAAVYYEGETPTLKLTMTSTYIGVGRAVTFDVSDRKSGIRSVWAAISKAGKEHVILDRQVQDPDGGKSHEATFEIPIDPLKLGLADGPATLRMVVRDNSWRRWWHGNISYLEKEVFIDTRPPDISILSRRHYINQGGTGLVIYRLSETCPQSGVFVGDRFFAGHSGYFDDAKILMSFFALDIDQESGTRMVVGAVDPAGNRTEAEFDYLIRRKVFKKDAIKITDRFLKRKVPEFSSTQNAIPGDSLLEKFIWANRDLRQENYRTIAQIAGRSTADILWKGGFLRLPGSMRKAGFGESRQYRYKGRVVDRQIHQGIDLASTARSPVPAANSGKVIHAGHLGIYGNTIVIDHGFGLLSTYSHLSQIDVQVEQNVTRGDIIGNTGSTGLAGGDHLHFGVFIQQQFVNPIEWWDAAWITNNITAKIKDVRSTWQ